MIICIVGKSGSGKSTIAKMIGSYSDDIYVLSGDLISHKTLEIDSVKNEIIEKIGNVLDENKNIDRRKLSRIVFSDKNKLDILNNISWKYMELMIDSYLYDKWDKIVIIDWLLVPLTKYFLKSDLNILVEADYEVRKNRVMKRDNITENEFYRRDSNALNLDLYKYDYIINNNYNIKESEVEKIYDKSIVHRKF